MSREKLLACLQAIQAPADVEEWLITAHERSASSGGESNTEYDRAIRDLLVGLGIISAETGEATSPMAYYLIQRLYHALDEGPLMPENWRGLPDEGCAGAGARLVHLMEETRLGCTANPTPLRIVRAVTSVIKARQAGQDVYLMQYDQKARQFQPIGGKQEHFDSDGEAALTRELCEELAIAELRPGLDFRIHPLNQDLKVDAVSASVHVLTRYSHSFYHLTDVRFPISIDEATRWLSAAEVQAGKTTDGLAITSLFEDYMPGVLPTLSYSLELSPG